MTVFEKGIHMMQTGEDIKVVLRIADSVDS